MLALAEVNQAVWVLHGKGDAGAFNEGDWQALPEKIRTQLRIFERSRPIQRGLIAFRGGLEPATRRALEEVMLALDDDEAGRRGAHAGRGHHALRAPHARGAPGGARLGAGAAAVARSLMRRTSIGTRYAAYVAALALALVVVALVAAGAIALSQMRVVQAELRDAVAAARAADDERALDGAARYLGLHLFNPLYQLDVERLNEDDPADAELAAGRVLRRRRSRRPGAHRRHARERALRRERARGAARRRGRRGRWPGGAPRPSCASGSPPAA